MKTSVSLDTATIGNAAAALVERQFPGTDEPSHQAIMEAALAHMVAGRVLAELVGADGYGVEALVNRVLHLIRTTKRGTKH